VSVLTRVADGLAAEEYSYACMVLTGEVNYHAKGVDLGKLGGLGVDAGYPLCDECAALPPPMTDDEWSVFIAQIRVEAALSKPTRKPPAESVPPVVSTPKPPEPAPAPPNVLTNEEDEVFKHVVDADGRERSEMAARLATVAAYNRGSLATPLQMRIADVLDGWSLQLSEAKTRQVVLTTRETDRESLHALVKVAYENMPRPLLPLRDLMRACEKYAYGKHGQKIVIELNPPEPVPPAGNGLWHPRFS